MHSAGHDVAQSIQEVHRGAPSSLRIKRCRPRYRSETYVGSSGYCCVTVWRCPNRFTTKWRVVTAIPRKISGRYNFCQNESGGIAVRQSLTYTAPPNWRGNCRAQHLALVRDRTAEIANLGVTEARITGDSRSHVMQYLFRRR